MDKKNIYYNNLEDCHESELIGKKIIDIETEIGENAAMIKTEDKSYAFLSENDEFHRAEIFNVLNIQKIKNKKIETIETKEIRIEEYTDGWVEEFFLIKIKTENDEAEICWKIEKYIENPTMIYLYKIKKSH